MPGARRCWWCGDDPLYVRYHDEEWGRPVVDDDALFEKLCLEGFQAGLAWITILRKRENFRSAFHGFEIERVARMSTRSIDRLLRDDGIVRHRGKIESAVNNAKRARELQREAGSLAGFLWQFAPRRPPAAPRSKAALMRTTTRPEAVRLATDLKRRGWSFLGPTTVYAFMQSVGMVNDHLAGCPSRAACERERGEVATAPPTRS